MSTFPLSRHSRIASAVRRIGLVALSAGAFGLARAETPISGTVTGALLASASPYRITGNLLVPSNSVLAIEAGVRMEFDGTYFMQVDGTIRANGSAAAPVVFTARNITNGWGGIRFLLNTNDNTFSFAAFEHGRTLGSYVSPYHGPSMEGASIYLDASRVTVRDCLFVDNKATVHGSAISGFSEIDLVVDRCRFVSNTTTRDAASAGALAAFANTPQLPRRVLVSNSDFSFNVARDEGSALMLLYGAPGASIDVFNNTFHHNATLGLGAPNASVAYISGGRIVNNTFCSNTLAAGSAGPVVAQVFLDQPAVFANNIVYGNAGPGVAVYTGAPCTVEYNDISGGYPGAGNISTDPLFVDVRAGDLHLLPASPCIDAAGSNAPPVDRDGMPRPLDGNGDLIARADVGAYERVTCANMASVPGGVNSGTNLVGPGESFSAVNYPQAYALTTTSFQIDRTEVTKALWDEVRSWGATNGYTDLPIGGGKGPDHPIQNVNWYDCVKWCNARSEKEGRTPAYYTTPSTSTIYRTGQTNLSDACVSWTTGYRLPTRTQWEYAARGGVSSRRFPWGGNTITHTQANYYAQNYSDYDLGSGGYHPSFASNATPYTSPAGALPAGMNGYGLYDMAGNVNEWFWEWDVAFGPGYRAAGGGGWVDGAQFSRVGARNRSQPTTRDHNLGFRTILPPDALVALVVAASPVPHGSPTPLGYGTNMLPMDTVVSSTVDSAVSEAAGTRYVCTGWTGAGSVPVGGSSNRVFFVITTNSTLTWNWRTEYWLDTAASGGGSVDTPPGQWLATGATVSASAIPTTSNQFVRWLGDVPAGQETANPLAVTMDRPRRITALFRPTSLLPGTVVYYSFDNVDGTNVIDLSGNGNHGLVQGGAVPTAAGRLGGGMRFNGSSGYLRITNNASLAISNLTLATWIFITDRSTHDMSIAEKGPHTSCWDAGIMRGGNITNNLPYLRGGGLKAVVVFPRPNLWSNQWYHVAMTINGTNGVIYLDGVQLVAGPVDAIAGTSGNLTVARDAIGDYFGGVMDEFMILSRALSSNEVFALYLTATNPPPAACLGLTVETPTLTGQAYRAQSLESIVVVTNSGAQAAAYSLAPGRFWMSVIPSTGMLAPGAGTQHVLRASTRGLEPRQYRSQIVLRSADLTNGTPTADVALVLTSACPPTVCMAWGDNVYGQTNIPANLTNAIGISGGGGSALALLANGQVVAWGYNNLGQTNVPPWVTNAVSVTAGGVHSLALLANGRTVAWGDNTYGQTNVPPSATNLVSATTWGYHSLGLRADGTVIAWGDNTYGQTNVPASATSVVSIAAGFRHSLALRANGTVIAWGLNTYGQTNVPPGISNAVGIAAGGHHSLILLADGSVVAWGYSANGQTTVPGTAADVVAVYGGDHHSMALLSSGKIVVWGLNDRGQHNIPTSSGSAVAASAGGYFNVMLLRAARLTIGSAGGSPQPAAGTRVLPADTTYTTVVDSVVSSGTTRYVCSGWTGTGSVPASGNRNSAAFALTQDSTLTWNWSTEYWLDTGVSGAGSVDTGDQWAPAGDSVTITATPAASNVFLYWSGDVPAGLETQNPLSLPMDQPRAITAVFALGPCYLSGDLSGVLTTAASPYCIVGNIRVPAGATLVIDPGVELVAQGMFGLTIDGLILANGTEESPILFTSADPASGWHGIHLVGNTNDNVFRFVVLEHGRATADASAASSRLDREGGAVYIADSRARFEHCTFSDSRSAIRGSALSGWNGVDLTLTRCSIFDSESLDQAGGYGAVAFGHDGTNRPLGIRLDGCEVADSIAQTEASGLSFYSDMVGVPVSVVNCLLHHGYAFGRGETNTCAAARFAGGLIANNTFVDNALSPVAQGPLNAAVELHGSNTFVNNIVHGHGGPGISLATSGDASDVRFNRFATAFPGAGNITADPLFVDRTNGNYRLRVSSPCIDAGLDTLAPTNDADAASRPLDGDLNGAPQADMGAYEFDATNRLPAPADMAVADGLSTEAITVWWRPAPGATTYDVWRNTSPVLASATRIASGVTGLMFQDTAVSPAQPYYYWVKAWSATAQSPFIGPDAGYLSLIAPRPVAASSSMPGAIRVQWPSVPGATSYEVWRGSVRNIDKARLVQSGLSASPFVDRTAPAGQTVYYWVRARNSWTAGRFSTPADGFARRP